MAGINDIAKATKLPAFQVKAVFDTIVELTKAGERISIQEFGSFEQVLRKAKTGRNPKTGEEVEIDAKNVLKFKQSKSLVMEPVKKSKKK